VPSPLDITHARWVLGLIPPEQAVEFAWQALAFGYDGALLRNLASLRTSSKWDVDQVFFPALREMGFEPYSNEEACRILIDDAADRILKGALDPLEGASLIRSYWHRSGFMKELTAIALPCETLLCDPRHDDALRAQILQVVRNHQPTT